MVANLGIGVVVLFSLFFITGSAAFSGRTGASAQSSRLQTKLRKRGFANLVRVKSQATKRQTVELRNLGFETARCTSSRILGWHTTPRPKLALRQARWTETVAAWAPELPK